MVVLHGHRLSVLLMLVPLQVLAAPVPSTPVEQLLRDGACPGCDLRGAPLQDAHLIGADLRQVDLRGADLRGANLEGRISVGLCCPELTCVGPGSPMRISPMWIYATPTFATPW